MFEKVKGFINHKVKETTDPEVRELTGTRAAIVAADGFEESELFEPKAALEAAGVHVVIVSCKHGKIRGWKENDWGRSISVDLTAQEAFNVDFDFLVLPGGVLNPDKLRNDPDIVALVESFVNKRRPIAAICHGVQTLIETGIVKGKTLTSWPSLRTDLINAGANWVDEEVIIDHRLITSRRPADLPVFNQAMIQEFVDYHISHSLPNTESYVVTL